MSAFAYDSGDAAYGYGSSGSASASEGSFWWWTRWVAIIFVGWVLLRVAVASLWRYMGWDSDFEMYVPYRAMPCPPPVVLSVCVCALPCPYLLTRANVPLPVPPLLSPLTSH